jgi:hypothetical protein
MLKFFTSFKAKYPDITIQLIKFQLLKPWFIRHLTTWSTCCYCYHTRVGLLLQALNEFKKDISGIQAAYFCSCEQVCSIGIEPTTHHACGASLETYESFTVFWSYVLCPISPNCLWHKRDYLLGECRSCGIDSLNIVQLSFYLISVSRGNQLVMRLLEWEKTTGRRSRPKSCTMKPCQRKPKLKAFICQNYFTQWQNQQFHKDLEELPADIVLSCIDFSKNYNMKVQDEIQSMY